MADRNRNPNSRPPTSPAPHDEERHGEPVVWCSGPERATAAAPDRCSRWVFGAVGSLKRLVDVGVSPPLEDRSRDQSDLGDDDTGRSNRATRRSGRWMDVSPWRVWLRMTVEPETAVPVVRAVGSVVPAQTPPTVDPRGRCRPDAVGQLDRKRPGVQWVVQRRCFDRQAGVGP